MGFAKAAKLFTANNNDTYSTNRRPFPSRILGYLPQ